MKPLTNKIKEIIKNKKVFYDFKIEKTFECGLQLKGWEVKSIRAKQINIVGSYIIFNLRKPYLVGATIHPVMTITDIIKYENKRNIKLLLHKKEINLLNAHKNRNGYTIVPISLFWKNTWCKLSIGIAKGKNKKDKRNKEKNESWKKQQSNIFKKIKLMK